MGQQEIYEFLRNNSPKRYTCVQLRKIGIIDVNTSTYASLVRRLFLWGFIKRAKVLNEGRTRIQYEYWVEEDEE